METFPTVDPSTVPHDNQGHVVIITGAVMCALATIFTIARLYTRHFIIRQIGVDDMMAVAALFTTYAQNFSQSYNASKVLGRHIYDLNLPGDIRFFFEWLWINELFYNGAMFFVKMTLILQYYRIFRHIRKMKWAYIGSMFLVGGWCLSQLLAVTFACIPVQGFWDRTIKAKCQNQKVGVYVNAAGVLATDLIVLFLPIPAVMNLKLPPSQKWALLGIFGLGGFTSAISIWRMTTLNSHDDIFYGSYVSASWTIVELCSGIIVAAMATIRPLLSRYVPGMRSLGSKGTSNPRYGPNKYGDLAGTNASTARNNNNNANPPQQNHFVQSKNNQFMGSDADLFGHPDAFEMRSTPAAAKTNTNAAAAAPGTGKRNDALEMQRQGSSGSLDSGRSESFNYAFDHSRSPSPSPLAFGAKPPASRGSTEGLTRASADGGGGGMRPGVETRVSAAAAAGGTRRGGAESSRPAPGRSGSLTIRVEREYTVHTS